METEGRGYEEARRLGRVGGEPMPPPGPMYGGGYGGGGWGYGRGPWRPHPIETKPFFLTSEFFGALLLIVAIAISAASDDGFDSPRFWTLTTVVVAAYVVSRGIAKSGTKSRATDPREQLFQGEGGRKD